MLKLQITALFFFFFSFNNKHTKPQVSLHAGSKTSDDSTWRIFFSSFNSYLLSSTVLFRCSAFPCHCISLRQWVSRLRCWDFPWSLAWCSGWENSLLYLRRLGAHTKARFLVCMLVMLLKEARWVKCLIRYSSVLQWFHMKKEKCVNWLMLAHWDSKAQTQLWPPRCPLLKEGNVCNGTTGPIGQRIYSTIIYTGWQWTPEQLCSGVAKDGAWTKQCLMWWVQGRRQMDGRRSGMLQRLRA